MIGTIIKNAIFFSHQDGLVFEYEEQALKKQQK